MKTNTNPAARFANILSTIGINVSVSAGVATGEDILLNGATAEMRKAIKFLSAGFEAVRVEDFDDDAEGEPWTYAALRIAA